MFAPVGRRLAILNAIVITVVVALVGALSLGVLQYRTDQEQSEPSGDVGQVGTEKIGTNRPRCGQKERETQHEAADGADSCE